MPRGATDIGPDAKSKVRPRLATSSAARPAPSRASRIQVGQQDRRGKGRVWTEDVLFSMEDPLSFMQGTKMAFAGLRDLQDRKD